MVRRFLIHSGCSDSQCPLYKTCRRLPTEVHTFNSNDSIDILFAGQGGGKTEYSKGLPFCGISGILLRTTVNHIGENKVLSVAYANTIRDCPQDKEGNNRPPTEEEIRHCLPLLLRDIKRLKPTVIVALGKSAANTFAIAGDYISDFRSILCKNDYGTIIPIFHPAAVARNPGQLGVFYPDIAKAIYIAQGRIKIPSYYGKKGNAVLLSKLSEVKDFVSFLMHDLNKEDVVACDTETANLNKKYGNRIATIQFSFDTKSGYMIPYQHIETPFTPEELEAIRLLLKDLFNKPVSFKYWLMHSATYDVGRIYNEMGFWIRNVPIICTMVMSFLLNENRKGNIRNPYKLKSLSREFFGFDHYHKGILKNREEGQLADLPLKGTGEDSLVGYGCMDTYCTQRLFRYLEQYARAENYYDKLMNLLINLYSDVYRAFALMEINGFKVDIKFLRLLQSDKSPIWTKLAEILDKFKQLDTVQKANTIVSNERNHGQSTLYSPWLFDLNKKDCLRALFHDIMKIPAEEGKKLLKGRASYKYSKTWYEPLQEQYKEVKLFADYQALKTLGTTFINQIEGYIEPSFNYEDCKDGRIRSSFLLINTVTGRTASTGPNMQNMPRPEDEDKKVIKNLFIPEIRNVIIQLDAKTAEVRWWALLSGDKDLIESFNQSHYYTELYRKNPNPKYKKQAELYGDFHKITASVVFKIPIEKVTIQQRQAAKVIGFGLLYGMGVKQLSKKIGNPNTREVQKLVDQFFNSFPIGTNWLKNTTTFAHNNFYVESPIGRRRRLPFLLSDKLFGNAERQAVNSPIQGISSDATLLIGSSLMTDYIIDNDKPWKCLNVVHDSNVAEIPENDIIEYCYTAEDILTTDLMKYMEKNFDFKFTCPLEVELEIGLKWGDLRKWDGTTGNLDEIVDWVRKVA